MKITNEKELKEAEKEVKSLEKSIKKYRKAIQDYNNTHNVPSFDGDCKELRVLIQYSDEDGDRVKVSGVLYEIRHVGEYKLEYGSESFDTSFDEIELKDLFEDGSLPVLYKV